mgnify:FL=1
MKAKIGEIWLVTIPVLEIDENNDINVKLQRRPCLILDDGRGLIVEEDDRNFHVLKLTTQYDRYKRRPIKNWKQIGLAKKSYIRIEMPIKIEENQLNKKLAVLPDEQLLSTYNDIYEIINIEALKKLSDKYKSEEQVK